MITGYWKCEISENHEPCWKQNLTHAHRVTHAFICSRRQRTDATHINSEDKIMIAGKINFGYSIMKAQINNSMLIMEL